MAQCTWIAGKGALVCWEREVFRTRVRNAGVVHQNGNQNRCQTRIKMQNKYWQMELSDSLVSLPVHVKSVADSCILKLHHIIHLFALSKTDTLFSSQLLICCQTLKNILSLCSLSAVFYRLAQPTFTPSPPLHILPGISNRAVRAGALPHPKIKFHSSSPLPVFKLHGEGLRFV